MPAFTIGGGGAGGGGGGSGGFGGFGGFEEIFRGGGTSDPWEGWKRVGQILGINDWTRQAWNALTNPEKRVLTQAARAIFLRTAVLRLPRGLDNRAAFQRSGGNKKVVELYQDVQHGAELPTPDLAAVAAVLAQLSVRFSQPLTRQQRQQQRERTASEARSSALPGPEPSYPEPLPPGAIGGPEPAWLRLLRILAESYRAYLDQRALARQQREQQMSIADSFSSVAESIINAAPAAMQTYYTARAQERAARNYSGVPLQGVTTAGFPMNLFEEPGVLEPGGIIESLGLEGDVERTATLWRRTMSGYRPVHTLTAANPASGSLSTWVNMGKPVLYTGDLSACKRVNRIAARVARVARRRGVSRGFPIRRRKAR